VYYSTVQGEVWGSYGDVADNLSLLALQLVKSYSVSVDPIAFIIVARK
jgi:hypothetical protein